MTDGLADIPDVQDVVVRGDEILVAARERLMKRGKSANRLHGGVWASADKGRTWSKVFKAEFCSAVLFMSDGKWAVGTNDHAYHDWYRGRGVFLSADRGKSWTDETDFSMTVPNVMDMVEDPFEKGTLWVGTICGSVFVRSREL